MNGLERHRQVPGATADSILDAIEFQTALLTLNAAVEAAHTGGPAWPAGPAPSAPAQAAGKEAVNRHPHAQPCCGAAANQPAVEAGWQRSLERLQKALAASIADLHGGADGRPHTQPPPATAPPNPIPVLRRKPRSTPGSFRTPPRLDDSAH